jgi:predicted dehydrogenase
METRLLGTKAGLLQRNLNEGYTFDAHIFTELNGVPFDLHLHPQPAHAVIATNTTAPSAMHDYAEAILNDRPHPAPGEEGLIVMELLDAIYESARSGAPVKL